MNPPCATVIAKDPENLPSNPALVGFLLGMENRRTAYVEMFEMQ
jgi:hypothetical protein